MALNFGGIASIFPQTYSQGLGISRERISLIMVAIDGTGDSDNIQDGIDMLNNGVGEVYIKEGTYFIDTPIVMQAGQTLRGAGYSTVISLTGNHAGITSSGNNVVIENLRLTGTDTGASQTGISLTGDGNYIKTVWVDNMGGNGILLTGTQTNEIIGCNISDCDNYGIAFNSSHLSIVTGCEITTCDKYGLGLLTSSFYNVVTGCNIHNCGSGQADEGGVVIGGTSRQNTIVGNTIRDNAGANETGLVIGSSANENLISSNVLENNTTNVDDQGTNTQIGHNIYS